MARRRGPSQSRLTAVPRGGPTWIAGNRLWRTATVSRRRGNRWIQAELKGATRAQTRPCAPYTPPPDAEEAPHPWPDRRRARARADARRRERGPALPGEGRLAERRQDLDPLPADLHPRADRLRGRRRHARLVAVQVPRAQG